GAELGSTYKQGPLTLYANFSYVQTSARNIDSVENEFATNALAYIATNPIQLDHQGRYTGSGGFDYTFLKDTQFYSDFLYGNGLRAGFANLEKLPAYWTENVGVEHVWHLHSKGISELRQHVKFAMALVSESPPRLTARAAAFTPGSVWFSEGVPWLRSIRVIRAMVFDGNVLLYSPLSRMRRTGAFC